MEETSGGATEEDPLPGRTDEQQMLHVQNRTTNQCLQDALTEYLIQIIIYVNCVDPGVDWAGRGRTPGGEQDT